ncbi:attacin-B-like [Teleopsis dalmanni]|uniref:attacin-B-like n=1 Tax=Teleopsis dalmanni TaxID=139649 RepID=UPI0018CED22B|nr:attacin-B-like [Teleopsis dalmanni]
MKYFIYIAVTIATLCVITEATPQRFQKLPYYPPPTRPPRPIRVRRDALSGSLASNPNGGADARLELGHAIGDPNHNLIGSVFAAGNTVKGPVATGGTLAYNNNGLGASLTKEHIPGVRDSFTQSVNANLFKSGPHSVDANAFKSQNTLANGFKFERNGGGLSYGHANGHGASLTQSSIPNFGKQLELAGKANLWSSQDRNTRLDLGGSASKWTSGPFSNQKTNFGGNLGLTHYFG